MNIKIPSFLDYVTEVRTAQKNSYPSPWGTFYEFSFTDKTSYLEFRRLWRKAYVAMTAQTRAHRQAKRKYKLAGGFRNELFEKGLYPKQSCVCDQSNLSRLAHDYYTTVPASRVLCYDMCAIRVASKLEAARQRALNTSLQLVESIQL